MTPPDPVQAFERAFAGRVGQSHAVSVTYARLGLRFLLDALGVRAGDEVIISALTCRVVVLAIQSAGCRPVYADLSSGGLNISAGSVKDRLTTRTRAIVFQHTYGTSTGLDAVADLARQHGIPLIEDCAQRLPPASSTRDSGARGIASIWSHNFRKPLPVGAGGCVVTADEALAGLVRKARDAGPVRSAMSEFQWQVTRVAYLTLLRPSTYWPLWSLHRRLRGDHEPKPLPEVIRQEVTSLPVRISSRQAEWGLRGLEEADRRLDHAEDLSSRYEAALHDVSSIGRVPAALDSPLYYYPVLARNKTALLDAARRRRMELIAWPLSTPIYPIERQTELAQSEYVLGSCPAAEDRARTLCGLPVDLMTTPRHAQGLIELLHEIDSGDGQ